MNIGAVNQMNDSLIIYEQQMEMPKKIRLEIPVGAIESDSGNHIVDGITVVSIILALYLGKKLVDRFLDWMVGGEE